MVAVSMALLFVAVRTFLLVLVVDHRLVRHVALLLVDGPAPLLAACVVHRPASGHCELITVFLVAYSLCKNKFITLKDFAIENKYIAIENKCRNLNLHIQSRVQ